MAGLFTRFTDFAPTAPQAAEPGGGLRLGRCRCSEPRLFRIRRSLWMRPLRRLRLYQCASCGARVLRPTLPVAAYSMRAYMPRYERR